MEARRYEKTNLFIGVLSTKGFPQSLKEKLEEKYGPIEIISDRFPFDFTSYYCEEMGENIERFFILFSSMISPDELASCKVFTNLLEQEWEEEGKRKINLDPGLITEASIILATTKNRSHRIAIGQNLYAEVTLTYQKHAFVSYPWTYSDYKDSRVQRILFDFRSSYLKKKAKLNKNA